MLSDKIKNLFSKKEGEPNKKRLENIVVFLVILIITIIVINVIWNDGNDSNEEQTTDSNKRLAETSLNTINDDSIIDSKDELTSNLESILSKIEGVGNVKVMVTYSETSQTVPIYNEETSQEDTEETDSEGGTRKVTQTDTRKEVIYEESDGSSTIITKSVISPKIEGAIITAQGASNATVKTNIIQAVEAVTGLATHKIQVFQMSN